MAPEEWYDLVLAVAKDGSLYDEVAFEVGQQHRVSLDSAPDKGERIERYLAAQETVPGEEDSIRADFEWVYPDEDSGSVKALADLRTGLIALHGELPEDATHSEVRVRLSTDGDIFEVERDASGNWCLTLQALYELRSGM
jgi:hypothetical protein